MKNQKVEIGVLIPTYNAEKFISQCIDSVINQTYKPTQIIICDDASKDNTVSIIREYQNKYPDLIKIICHKENIGIPANFNSGLESLTTEYVSINAGDDIWARNKLLNEVNLLSEEIQCVYSACALIDEQGNRTGKFKRKYDGDEGNLLFQMLMHEMAFRNPLLKMSVIEEIGFFNEDLEIFEDWQLKIEYLEKVNVAFSKEETVYYRMHPEGISSRSNSIVYYDCLKAVYENVSHIIDTLDKDEKQIVLNKKKKDLQKFLIDSLRSSNNLTFGKKIIYMKDLALMNPFFFLNY